MTLTSWLYRIARVLNDTKAVKSGSGVKMVKRTRNKVIGRGIGKLGLWK